MDARTCNTRRTSEESTRQREQGWFLLRALQTAQMSFDLSHIPSSMVRPFRTTPFTHNPLKSSGCSLFDCRERVVDKGQRSQRTFTHSSSCSNRCFYIQAFLFVLSSQVYGEHYKLAIYVTPSRCDDEVCNSARIRLPAAETMPCRQPLDMPTGFLDSTVPKNQTLNFTIFALEDVLLKVRKWVYVSLSCSVMAKWLRLHSY